MANNPQAVIEVLGFFTENLQTQDQSTGLAAKKELSKSTDLLVKELMPQGSEKDMRDSVDSRAGTEKLEDDLSKVKLGKGIPPPPPLPVKAVPPPPPPKQASAQNVTTTVPPAPAPPPTTVPPSEKPIEREHRRLSGLTDPQLTEILKTMVSKKDPTTLYTKIKTVGQGASGSVYLARNNETEQLVAVKDMILNRQPRLDMLINEINVMKEIVHPNIVNFMDCFLVKESLWVVMEYMEGGMLTEIIDKNNFTESQIATICLETLRGLNHLHSKNIIHRDIKSDNVLLDAKGRIKICISVLCSGFRLFGQIDNG
jgi:protein-serine/threonine kinase